MQKAQICIDKSTLLQGDKKCVNPKITWIDTGDTCLIINCEDEKCITVQIPEDCSDKCVSFIIECDDCDECPPQIITRCLCEDGECPPCFVCIDGFCHPKPCPDGQICDPSTGDCVDCITNEDCPCDQECVQGECGCPPGTIEHPITKCCVECVTADDCEGCDVCISGNCEEKDCGDGVINPNTCDCQECLIADDCDKENECCVQGVCRCCPGYTRNPETGECDPNPPCTDDDDCPECFICTPEGCVPLECPEGFVCVDGECVRECTCPSGPCPPGTACTEVSLGLCICVPTDEICSGPCDGDSDCDDPRCECVDNECVFVGPPPTDDCEGPCNDGKDCKADDCGCLENECVDCTEISCEENDDCPNGCFCDDGTCAGNPCTEIFCQDSNDCGLGCGCTENGECVPCSSLDCSTAEGDEVEGCECVGDEGEDDNVDPSEDCEDIFEFTQGDCDLTLTQTTENCCQCEDMSLVTDAALSSQSDFLVVYDFDQIVINKNGQSLASYPQLQNEPPVSGNVEIRVVDIYGAVTQQGVPLFLQEQEVITSTGALSFTPGGATVGDVVVGKPGAIIPNGIISGITFDYAKLLTRRIEIRTPIKHTYNNGCEYRIPAWATMLEYLSTNSIPVEAPSILVTTNMQRLVNCRVPLWRIYRRTVNQSGNINFNSDFLFSVYPDQIANGLFQFVMDGQLNIGGPVLEYGAKYAATSDCGCNNVAFNNCNGPNLTSATPLVFCDPRPIVKNVDFKFVDCNSFIEFLRDIEVTCDIYGNEPLPVYQIFANGELVDERQPNSSGVVYEDNEQILMPEGITELTVEFKIKHDECEDCTITVESPELITLDADFQKSCDSADITTFFATVGNVPNGFTLTIEEWPSGTVLFTETYPTAGAYTVTIPNLPNGTYRVRVVDTVSECSLISDMNINPGADLTGVVVTIGCDGTQPVITLVNNTGEPVTFEIEDTETSTAIGISPVTVAAGATLDIAVDEDTEYEVAYKGDITDCENDVILPETSCCENNPIQNTTVGYNCTDGWVVNNKPTGADIVAQLNGGGSEIPVEAGEPIAPGNYVVTISLDDCERVVNVFVPQCYECDNGDCVAATPNKGFPFSQCGQCEPPCETCDFVFYGINRLYSLHVGGEEFPLNAPVALECIDGVAVEDSGFLASLLQALSTAGECSQDLNITMTCIAYNPAEHDPEGCLDAVVDEGDPIVQVLIENSGVDLTGVSWLGPGCVVPVTSSCDTPPE